MMTFAAGDRPKAAEALLAAQQQAMAGGSGNARMTWEVGYPLCAGLRAFGRGDYATCISLLRPLRSRLHRFGGSHAQRDLLTLTLIESAIRAGQGTLARGLAAERTDLKPNSPFSWQLAARAAETAGDASRAEQARELASSVNASIARPRAAA